MHSHLRPSTWCREPDSSCYRTLRCNERWASMVLSSFGLWHDSYTRLRSSAGGLWDGEPAAPGSVQTTPLDGAVVPKLNQRKLSLDLDGDQPCQPLRCSRCYPTTRFQRRRRRAPSYRCQARMTRQSGEPHSIPDSSKKFLESKGLAGRTSSAARLHGVAMPSDGRALDQGLGIDQTIVDSRTKTSVVALV